MAQNGGKILCADINETTAKETAQMVNDQFGKDMAIAQRVDVANAESVQQVSIFLLFDYLCTIQSQVTLLSFILISFLFLHQFLWFYDLFELLISLQLTSHFLVIVCLACLLFLCMFDFALCVRLMLFF